VVLSKLTSTTAPAKLVVAYYWLRLCDYIQDSAQMLK
jgi:hypothetical protein